MENAVLFKRIVRGSMPLEDKVELAFDLVGQDFSNLRSDPTFGMKLAFLYDEAFHIFAPDPWLCAALLNRVAQAHAEALHEIFVDQASQAQAISLVRDALAQWVTLAKYRDIRVNFGAALASAFGDQFEDLREKISIHAACAVARMYECYVEGVDPKDLEDAKANAFLEIWNYHELTFGVGGLSQTIYGAVKAFQAQKEA
ncbi:hypothetical protein RYA05_02975 [Pseudomonas syringae pv. actinidiae]|nr:hypothetical protein [Pseudomonas syringae pv. actinidiae]